MPRVFNFYQGTGFGTGISAPINTGNAIDFFTGVYFPLDLSLGKSVGFLWPASDVEIPYSLTVSGSQESSNKQIAFLGMGLYGYVSPLIRESGNIFISVKSGNIDSSRSDITLFKTNVRSQISGDNIDRPILKLLFNSGAQISGSRDIASLQHTHTGEIISGNREVTSFILSFYGKFTPPDLDHAATMLRMIDITYEDTTSYTKVNDNTGMFVRFRMDTIIYDDAI